MTFEELDLDEKLISAIQQQNFHKPTPVQLEAIPLLMQRHDVLAGAATGTGKTAAFVLPALQLLIDEPKYTRSPRIMILAPTRELAFQIHKVIRQLGHYLDFTSAVITGGFAQDKQLEKLKDTDLEILVATPGRLLNIMSNEYIDLSDLEMVILDEADRMLDMGQGEDVLNLLEAIPSDFQAACFSATLAGNGIEKFVENILDDFERVQIDAPNQQSQQIQQFVYFADDLAHKQALLLAHLRDATCQSAIVFCNKKETAIALSEWLIQQEMNATVLHGDFIQAKRLEKLKKFRDGRIQILVATDVAARGIDIDKVSHIINYDMALRGDTYIHRIGRTGRGTQVGIAISLIQAHDLSHLRRIEYHLNAKVPIGKVQGLEPKTSFFKNTKSKKKPHKKKLAKKKSSKKK